MEKVLVFPTSLLNQVGYFDGINFNSNYYLSQLLSSDSLAFMDRDLAETDPAFKQLIPYHVFTLNNDYVFVYERMKAGGEDRLHNKWSIGIGGHINDGDVGDNTYENGRKRELLEEIETDQQNFVRETDIAVINDDSTPVGEVHFGVVYLVELSNANLFLREDSMKPVGFLHVDFLKANLDRLEKWSQLLINNWS